MKLVLVAVVAGKAALGGVSLLVEAASKQAAWFPLPLRKRLKRKQLTPSTICQVTWCS